MYKVGITGGIGSGKSVVSKIFSLLKIPVFNADEAAKYLMENDEDIVTQIQNHFGNHIYKSGRLDRSLLASIVFKDKQKLQTLSQIVHPATIAYSEAWAERQHTPYIIKEAAIFFESGSYKEMNFMIGVFAPVNLRIARVIKRDRIPESEVRNRINKQMDEIEKMKRCDWIIHNDNHSSLICQVIDTHHIIMNNLNNN